MFIVERDAHSANYTCISNTMLRDERLSLAARGFFAVVLSLPDSWDFSVSGMARLVGVNKDTALRYIRELEFFGYVRIECKSKRGRYIRKSYTFFESGVTENASPQPSEERSEVAENTSPQSPKDGDKAAESSVPKSSVPKKAAQININISNKNKKNTDLIDQQINGEILRKEFGGSYIDRVVEVIADCMKAKSRTISGESVDNAELVRVLGEVSEADIRRVTEAVRGRQPDNFAAYFGSALFNQIRSRLDKPISVPSQQDSGFSSFDAQAVDEMVLAKYRRV